nr:hypothetical protein [Tanacetum cinerariifolium]
MTGNRALLMNSVEKFLGMVRFGNNDFAVIAGHRDVIIRSMTIKKVYYVEGLECDKEENPKVIAPGMFKLNVSHVSNLNKNFKRYSRKDLLACNNSHLGETRSDFVCNDAMNVSCDSRMNDLLDDNNLFIFDDVNVRISPVSKMPVRKKPNDSMH